MTGPETEIRTLRELIKSAEAAELKLGELKRLRKHLQLSLHWLDRIIGKR
jgi:hypothetical protein